MNVQGITRGVNSTSGSLSRGNGGDDGGDGKRELHCVGAGAVRLEAVTFCILWMRVLMRIEILLEGETASLLYNERKQID